MLKTLLTGCVMCCCIAAGWSQSALKSIRGRVSFVTSSSVYVKFDDTKDIAIGDTLFLVQEQRLIPSLIVKNKSSISCVTTPINENEIKKEDQIVFQSDDLQDSSVKPESTKSIPQKVVPVQKNKNRNVRGSLSAASYSNFSNLRDDSHRTMYRLSLSAEHINQSKFSLDTYINYRQTFVVNDSATVHRQDVLNIYNLALRYDITPTAAVTIGRKINPKISSVGAIDGLQVEKSFGHFYTGMIAGFRPDLMDYAFNKNLFEYGGYLGASTDKQNFNSQTTLGFLEQQNNGRVDRRYTYFQHSSTLLKKISLFSSFELDLFSRVNGEVANDTRLTNFYASLGYRISRKIDISVAYDSRKQILYYETFKTDIERLLDNDDARQGLRYRINFRPFKYISFGANYSQRFQHSGLNQSENMNGYISLSKLPGLGGRLFINVNKNTSSYLESQIMSFRHTRTLIKMKLDADFYYRLVNYAYLTKEVKNEQQYYGASLSYRIANKMMFTLLGEMATLSTAEENYRVNVRISKNF